MGKAKMLVSVELLRELLHLPENAEILTAETDIDDLLYSQVTLVVVHPDIPNDAQSVSASYLNHYDENGNITKVEFTGWVKHPYF